MAWQLGRAPLQPAIHAHTTSVSRCSHVLRASIARSPAHNRPKRKRRQRVLVQAVQEEASSTLTPEQKDESRNKQKNDLKEAADREWKATLQRINDQSQADAAENSSNGTVAPLKMRLQHAIEDMQKGLVERDTEVRLLLLAALAQEHVLYIGPPGTAKSELGRRLSRLCKGTFFERLLTRFSVPEELFGPLSMSALEEDKYVRQTEGYLPKANVAFIDEIFKANSAILNTLLTVLNERLFDNGTSREAVPLLCMVGASNELPESEELDALYDRFLIRRQVSPVSNVGLNAMLQAAAENNLAGTSLLSIQENNQAAGQPSLALSFDECQQIRQQAVRSVSVPAEVRQLLADLRTHLAEKVEPPVYISDRRLVKAVALMQVAAYTSGKDSVGLLDCLLLQHILWQQPDQQARITDFLLSQISEDDGLKSANYILASIFSRACSALCGQKHNRESVLKEATALKESLADKLSSLRASQGGHARGSGIGGNMWISEDESEIVASTLFPKMKKTKQEHEDLLYEAVTLEVALGIQVDPVVLSDRMPKRWADFVRNAPMDEVRPLATQKSNPYQQQSNPFSSRPNRVSADPQQSLRDIDAQLQRLRQG